MKSSIKFYSPFFFPEPISTGRYNTILAKALAEAGYDVNVAAFFPVYPMWRPRFSKAELKGIRINRGGLFLRFPKSAILRRLVLEVGYLFHAVTTNLFSEPGRSVIAVFPPILFFALIRLMSGKKSKAIGIVHDIQGIMAGLPGYMSKRAHVHWLSRLEKKVFSLCDRVIVLSNGMAEVLHRSYGISGEIIRVHYPFVTLNKSRRTIALRHLFPEGFRHIVYSGALGVKQNPAGLYRLFQGIIERYPDVICHFFSRGPVFDELRREKRGAENRIRFHDLVPEHNLYELYLRSHVQIVPQLRGISNGAIPSKLPNLMAAGVPIFAVGDPGGELNRLVCRYGHGVFVDSWEVDVLIKKMNQLLTMTENRTHDERQRDAKLFVERHFSITPLIEEIRQCIPLDEPVR